MITVADAAREARAMYRPARHHGWPVTSALRSAARIVRVDIDRGRRARKAAR